LSEFFNNFLAPTKTVYSMWVIMAAIVLVAFVCTRKMTDKPSVLQNIAEMAVSGLRSFFEGVLGAEKTRRYFPLLATFFIFIIVCNYTGLIPGAGEAFTVPTSVLAVTSALSVISFVIIQSQGIRKKGFGRYMLGFFKPVALLFPLMLLEQFTRPLSMALRLYGNVYGEEMAAETLFELFPVLLPLVMHVLSLLFCFIQAMVFSMLFAVFLNEAVEDEEEENHGDSLPVK